MSSTKLAALLTARHTSLLRWGKCAVILSERVRKHSDLYNSHRTFIRTSFRSRDFASLSSIQISAYSSTSVRYNEDKGEEMYNLAMDALKKAEEVKKSKEEKLLREQYDAMNKQRQRTQQRENARAEKREADPRLAKLNDVQDSRDRAAGVAVVRTIVKQSQPNKIRIDQHTNEHDEHFWQAKARSHMEEAAFRYGNPPALVRLGNDALEQTTESNFIDKNQLEAWMVESPLDLQKLIMLTGDYDMAENKYHEILQSYQQLAVYLYKQAGLRGSAEAWYNLGHLLWDSIDIENSNSIKDEAFDAFHRSMKLGDIDAMYFLAVQYLSFDDEATEFTSLLNKARAVMDSEQLQIKIHDHIIRPIYLEMDLHKFGYNLLHQAALEHNHGPALHHLSLLHLEKNEDVDEFKVILSKAAATGHPDSLFLQGHCYYNGEDGHEQDIKAALDCFLAAAENEHVDAMVSAGAILVNGVRNENGGYIVERDPPRAFDLYQQAGEMGSQEGWRNVVHCYATGLGVPKCLDSAKHIAETMLKNNINS
eukprot:scaffold80687_cov49-Cyclotella_meneghiniana.AAC.1